jgi:TRAP-type C4-dicarboxylate transport system permease small subunit
MFDLAMKRLSKGIEAMLGLMLAVMVALVFGNVVLRYGLNSGIAISEEISRYIFVWMTFLGAIVALREHSHLGVDSLVRKLPRKGKLFCAVVSDMLMLFAVALLFQGSWKQAVINYPTKSPVAEISMAYLYLPGVIASVAMGILILLHLYQVLFVGATDEDLVLTVESEELANVKHATAAAMNEPVAAAGGQSK